MTKFRALMLSTVAAGLALGTVSTEANADAVLASSGTDKTELTVKGHVNRGIMIVGDGAEVDTFFVDGDPSQSRLTFTGKGKISEDLSVKAWIEVGFNENDSSSVANTRTKASAVEGDDATVSNSIGTRHVALSFISKRFGTLTTGQTSDAADGAFGIDLSGTALSGAYADLGDVGGSLVFVNSATDITTAETVGGNWTSGDGTRTDLVKYSTPSFGGFQGHFSAAQGGWMIGSATYSGKIGGFQIVGGAGYSSAAGAAAIGGAIDTHWVGSVSVLHDSGFSGTYAFTVVDDLDNQATRDEPQTHYGKVGYQANLVDMGKSYFSIGYGNSSDAVVNGDDLNVLNFGFVQNIDAAATELYVSISHADFDDATTTNYEELVWGMAGARVKF